MCVAITFSLRTAFDASHRFWYVVFPFWFVSRFFFYFPFDFFHDPLAIQKCVNFHIFVNFPALLLLLISSFIALLLEEILDMILIFLNFLRPICCLRYDLPWIMSCVHLRRLCILLLWARMYMYFRSILLGVVNVQCFLIDFLSVWSIHCWKWSIEVPYYYCIVVYYSLHIS